MKRLHRILALSGMLLLLVAPFAWAQPAGPGPGMGGRGPGGGMGPGRGMGPVMQYDPQNLETVSGEVTQVQKSQRGAKGILLQVKTDKETLLVMLGPAAYVEQNMQIAVQDKVEIKGTRIQHPQQALLIAGEVKKGDQVLKLRDDQGKPLWPRQGPMQKPPTE